MAIIDITKNVSRTDGLFDRDRSKNIKKLIEWLSENVGEYYGVGEDHTKNNPLVVITATSGKTVAHIGSGWQIERDWKGDPDGYMEVCWLLDITDDAKATMFALKFAV